MLYFGPSSKFVAMVFKLHGVGVGSCDRNVFFHSGKLQIPIQVRIVVNRVNDHTKIAWC